MEKLKQEFYKETDSLLGGTFKDHVRDALWTWIEDKLSRPVQAGVIKKNAEGLLPCPFCGESPMQYTIDERPHYGYTGTKMVKCNDIDCTLWNKPFTLRDWNKRK